MAKTQVAHEGRPIRLNVVTGKIVDWFVEHQILFGMDNFRGRIVVEANFDCDRGSVQPQVTIAPKINEPTVRQSRSQVVE